MHPEPDIIIDLHRALNDNILHKWYPLVLDTLDGGYFTNVSHDWRIEPEQEKMVVSQARHIWTASKAAGFYDDGQSYIDVARHGYAFLRDHMWDAVNGGFYQIRNRRGGLSMVRGWRDEKRTYGNAFGLYALAALYHETRDADVLAFAQTVFHWIEDHAFDPEHKGYFQFFTGDSHAFDRTSEYKTIADDGNELGFKDQNSSIHLLEAYTELCHVWKDSQLKTQLKGILELIRDVMVNEKGYLQLFFHPDWTPVSFRDARPEIQEQNHGLDHVSFGHDYETALLMLEASHALGIENDTKTLAVAKKMLDHAIRFGFDTEVGGFYDAGYYYSGSDVCSIIRDTKNWWAQAEALNALLLFSRIYPEEQKYADHFSKQWAYVQNYVLDHERGDWFEGGIDKEPHFITGPKSHMWKCTYHTSRALMNCITLLSDDDLLPPESKLAKRKHDMDTFIGHWKSVASSV
jgi:mannobiose 2-epimerase